jgi:hypothetical protein
VITFDGTLNNANKGKYLYINVSSIEKIDKHLYMSNLNPSISNISNNYYIVLNGDEEIDLKDYSFNLGLLSTVYVGSNGDDNSNCGEVDNVCKSMKYSITDRLINTKTSNLTVYFHYFSISFFFFK